MFKASLPGLLPSILEQQGRAEESRGGAGGRSRREERQEGRGEQEALRKTGP